MSTEISSEFLLRLNAPDTNGFYPVEAIVDGIGLWTGGKVKFDFVALAEATAPNEYGRRLWAMLVDRDTGWEELRDIPRGVGTVRFCVMLSVDRPAADLHRIKWELLIPKGDIDPVGVDVDRPISRFLPLAKLPRRDTSSTRQVLLAIANPADLGGAFKPIDVNAEVDSLLTALEPGIRENRVRLTVMPGRTGLPPELKDRLNSLHATLLTDNTTASNIGWRLEGKDVLHLIAHGNFDKDLAVLVLENDLGTADAPNTNDLIVQWGQRKPVLIFLQSCLSDPEDKTLPIAGLGPGFVEQGVPAVIAMRDLVDMKAARFFAAAFYRNLLETGEPDVAANFGRSVNYKGRSTAWAIPVLYSRLRPGEKLWNPDPLIRAIKALGRRWAATRDVSDPLPTEVTVVRDLSIVRRELDKPAIDVRVDALDTVIGLLTSKERQSRVVIILGPRGYAKTSVLKCAFVRLAEDLSGTCANRPIFVRLADCAGVGNTASFVNKAWERLLRQEDTPIEDNSTLKQVESGPLQMLIDGDDDLGAELLRSTLSRLTGFVQEDSRKRHLVITMDESAFHPDMFDSGLATVLILKDLRVKPLEKFLEKQDLKPGVVSKLAGPLRDLARVPWLLSRILEIAVEPETLGSRFQVLQRIVRGKLSEVAVSPGAGSLARFLLQEMAWQLQYRHLNALSLDETYRLLTQVRGTRDFPLDEFRRSIIRCRLWVESGPEGVRFAYSAAQDYFAACYLADLPPRDRQTRLRDIVAGLGRLEQLHRWQEVLVLLAGHLHEPGEMIKMLLELGFGEGEHLLLAARCIHEAQGAGREIPTDLAGELTDSLIWWSLPQSGIPTRKRRRAVDGLSYLIRRNSKDDQWTRLNNRIVCHLLKLAVEPVRSGLQSQSANRGAPKIVARLDYSIIRLAAMLALFQNRDLSQAFLAGQADRRSVAVTKLIEYWESNDLAGLRKLLNSDEDTVIAGAAAFALAAWGTSDAIQCLRDRFFALPINADIHWSIIDSLTELKSEAAQDVIKEVTHSSPVPEDRKRVFSGLQHYIAYAIGKCGALVDQAARDYLENCWQSEDVVLQGRAIRSRAQVAEVTPDESDSLRAICHQVLEEKFSDAQRLLSIDPPRRLDIRQKRVLTMYVIEALEHIGDDITTVPLLRAFYLRPGSNLHGPKEEMLRRSSWEMAERIRLRCHRQRDMNSAIADV